MKDPVPLVDGDIDPGVKIFREVDASNLGNRGRAQYFFHAEDQVLPIRDILDKSGYGNKLEPCIERKAENYCIKCVPGNIGRGFAKRDSERYLFLFTRCRNESLEQYWTQYYVGYIEKQRILDIDGRTAVQGPMKLVSFEDAVPLGDVHNPDTRNQKKLDEDKTKTIYEKLSGKENIYNDCLEKVEQLEAKVGRARYWEDSTVPPPNEGC